MKPDLYTKAVLTVIALALTVIACNQYVNPRLTANAQAGFSGVQFSWAGGPEFFDTRTGEVWQYDHLQLNGPWVGRRVGQMTKLGGPMK
jgi:hypothetical protein